MLCAPVPLKLPQPSRPAARRAPKPQLNKLQLKLCRRCCCRRWSPASATSSPAPTWTKRTWCRRAAGSWATGGTTTCTRCGAPPAPPHAHAGTHTNLGAQPHPTPHTPLHTHQPTNTPIHTPASTEGPCRKPPAGGCSCLGVRTVAAASLCNRWRRLRVSGVPAKQSRGAAAVALYCIASRVHQAPAVRQHPLLSEAWAELPPAGSHSRSLRPSRPRFCPAGVHPLQQDGGAQPGCLHHQGRPGLPLCAHRRRQAVGCKRGQAAHNAGELPSVSPRGEPDRNPS